jgi:hypothetical protein
MKIFLMGMDNDVTVLTYFKVLILNFLGGTGGKYEQSQTG